MTSEVNGNMYQSCESCENQIFHEEIVETSQGLVCQECAEQCWHCGEWLPIDDMHDIGDGSDPICNNCHETEMQKRHDAGVVVWYVGTRRYEKNVR